MYLGDTKIIKVEAGNMKKFGLFAIVGYLVPFVFAVVTKYFTKWGQDVENCIFAFLVGIAVQSIIGVFGLIAIPQKTMRKERRLFLLNIFPLVLLGILFILSKSYQ